MCVCVCIMSASSPEISVNYDFVEDESVGIMEGQINILINNFC
jgi:hypothetical protein